MSEQDLGGETRCRLDGVLQGASGPLFPDWPTRRSIAGRMGWADSGAASPVITRTLAMLREGKAVRLTSHYGVCLFQPLAEGEDGADIPASRDAGVYDGEGRLVERLVSRES